ncbi:MAG TPA: hypothetical protein VFG10_09985 [Saprospiraceae bacterium]|nr:hypothetical protein [Saprospiraceae bacterium]
MNVKRATGIFILSFFFYIGHAQTLPDIQHASRKGSFYIYWGWNRAMYTESDIHFIGENFDFRLENVKSHDVPSSDITNYINPFKVTIPQTNFRVGYFIQNHYALSVGFDHMKYVVGTDQVVKINGVINNTETIYDGNYSNQDITINSGFLQFEHTNGLNYINMDVRRFDEILDLNKIKINLTEGVGAGILLPKTDATLFGKNNNDEYHLSGYGMSSLVGLNISFFKFLFLQSEGKFGYINMPDIRISKHNEEKASQSFLFAQFNILIGATFKFHHKKA